MSSASPRPKVALPYDPDQILRHAKILLGSGAGCVEVRVLDADIDNRDNIIPGGRYTKTVAGWFDDPNKLLEQVRRIRGVSAFITPNPVTKDLLARVNNRLTICKSTTTDKNIVQLNHWFIDFDPKRPTGISSTNAESEAAVARRDKFLIENPEIRAAAYSGTSGNGTFVLVRLPGYPNDKEHVKLIAEATELVVKRYSDDQVELDTSVKNPARIMSLAGTMKCKGENLPDRPHRMARIEGPDAEPAILDLKAWLGKQPKPSLLKSTPKVTKPCNANASNTLDRARKCVFGMNDSIEGSKGHNQLYGVAIALIDGFGLDAQDATTILTDWNEKKAKPPESPQQVAHKIAQAIKNFPVPSLSLLNAPRPEPTLSRNEHQAEPERDQAVEQNLFTESPRPLKSELLEVPQLPVELVPLPLRAWIQDIARRGSIPIEYPAAAAMTAISSLIGRNLALRPKKRDDWTVVPNLWGGVIGPPGLQKTSSVDAATLPITRLEIEATRAHQEAKLRAEEDAVIAKARAKESQKKLEKAVRDGASENELRHLAAMANGSSEIEEPTAKRYIVQNFTIEKLGELLGENPRGLFYLRDELTGMFKDMEKQGHESDRTFLLACWNGNGRDSSDRIGRGSNHVDGLCLSIFGTIQPGPMAKYLKRSATGEDADGFMPRFQMLVYPDPPEKFVNVDEWPDTLAKADAFEVFRWIDSANFPELGAMQEEDGKGLPFLRFDEDAQSLFDEWRDGLENRLRSGSESNLMESHLSKFRSLMPSLALLIHVVNSVGCQRIESVSYQATEQAAAWCDFLEAHARRIYQYAVEGDPEIAANLGERIKKSLPNPFTFRVVANKGWAGLDTVEDVRRAVGILEDRNWVKVLTKPPGPKGGAPSDQVWINPALYGL